IDELLILGESIMPTRSRYRFGIKARSVSLLLILSAIVAGVETVQAFCDPQNHSRFIPKKRRAAVRKSPIKTEQSSWVRLMRVGEARQEVGVAELNGKIYLVGGIITGAVSNSVEIYDPRNDRWSFVAPMPETLHHTSAVSLNGQLYVIGGYNNLRFDPVSSAYRYDPATNRWTAIASLPNPRGALSSVVIGNRIYAVGGARGPATGELTVYDPTTDRWTDLAPMPTPREHIAAGAVKGKLYVAGGRNSNSFTLNTLEEYDPASNSWRSRTAMPTGRSGIAGAVAIDRFYVFGGEGNFNAATGCFADNESYDPVTNSWRKEEPMPTPRHGIAAATIEGRIYLPAGAPVQGFSITSINEAFNTTKPAPPQNLAPEIEPVADQIVRGGEQLCLDLRVKDPEGDPITVSCAGENPAFVKCNSGFTICLNPAPSDEGKFTACAIARDSAGNQAKGCFFVTVIVNHTPKLDKPADLTLQEGDFAEIKISASDIDNDRDPTGDGRISLALIEGPNFIKFNDEGRGKATLMLTPAAGAGGSNQQAYTITIAARDNGKPPLEVTTSFVVTVKTRPSQPTVPNISTVTFQAKRLTVNGQNLAPQPQVEINGKLTDASRFTLQSDMQIILKGNRKKLNLRKGTNTLVVIVNGVRSMPANFMVGN
ncbi:MAG: kelch repeat-containing protein, partial [Acidobacteriota bacterium]